MKQEADEGTRLGVVIYLACAAFVGSVLQEAAFASEASDEAAEKQAAIQAVVKLYEKPVQRLKDTRKNMEASRKRRGIINRIETLAWEKSKAEGRAGRCTDADLLEPLLRPLSEDIDTSVRNQTAQNILRSFDLGVVDKHRERVEQAAGKHRDTMLLVLYGLLPSCDKEKAKQWLKEEVGDRGLGAPHCFYVACALARLGDKDAEDKLMAFMEVPDGKSVSSYNLFHLTCAPALQAEMPIFNFLDNMYVIFKIYHKIG